MQIFPAFAEILTVTKSAEGEYKVQNHLCHNVNMHVLERVFVCFGGGRGGGGGERGGGVN